jgi:predicted amidohydrolase YtcJ
VSLSSLSSLLVIDKLKFGTSLHQNKLQDSIRVFVAKRIITMDPGWPFATAVAVKDDKILSAGSLEDLYPWIENNQYEIVETFKEKIIMPGFIEPHSHPIMGGLMLSLPLLSFFDLPSPYGDSFKGLKTKSEALERLAEYNNRLTDSKQALVVWGYDKVALGEPLTATDLDMISTTRPILVWDASEHVMYANSVQLQKASVTRDSTKINGVCSDASGNPNGQFEGLESLELIAKDLIPPMILAKGTNSIQYIVDLSRKNGITTTSELNFGGIDFDTELKTYHHFFSNSPSPPIRIVAVVNPSTIPESQAKDTIEYVRSLEAESTDRLIFKGVKFFCDDAFLALSMQVTNPGYIDGHRGLWNTSPGNKFFDLVHKWWEAGFHIHVHTNGNAAQEATINLLSSLQLSKPRFDHRFTLEHFGISTQAQIRRLKELGAVVGVNPYYVYHRGEISAHHIGTDRAHKAARMGTLLQVGVITAMHSDTPVGPPVPLEWVWIAVNRSSLSGRVLAPMEQITVHEALRMITIDAAFVLGVDSMIGSIEAGKFADFVVLEQDPYKVPTENIRNIQVWGTVVSGEVFPASEIDTK